MKEVIFKLPDDVLSLIIHKVENTPQEACLLEKWIYDGEERKKGKWVLVHPLQDDDGGAYVCSCCGTGSWEIDPTTWRACPWCTNLMEVEDG